MKKIISLYPLFFLISQHVLSQEMAKLFLHTDKNIYKPGETIWFTGYILNRDQQTMERQHVLYTVLVDTAHKTAATENRFLIESGIIRGDIQIPDSVKNGHYYLMAYTDDVYEVAEPPCKAPIIIDNRPLSFLQNDHVHSTGDVRVDLKTDTATVQEGGNITLSIHLTDSEGRPIQGMFSVGVAEAGKVCASDITTYKIDTSVLLRSVGNHMDPDYGLVFRDGKPSKQEVHLIIMGKRLIQFKSGPSGKFDLPFSLLTGSEGASLFLSVAELNTADYKIVLRHSTDSLDSLLTHFPYSDTLPTRILLDSNATGAIMAPGKMAAAVVKGKFNDDDDPGNTRGDCSRDIVYLLRGDRGLSATIAGSKILNWRSPDRHEYTTEKPVEGVSYVYFGRDRRFTPNGDGTWVYHCAAPAMSPFLVPLKVVRLPRPYTPEINYDRSTLYWAPLVNTDEKGNARLSFAAGSVAGKFICTVEGISQAGPLYGQTFFLVVH